MNDNNMDMTSATNGVYIALVLQRTLVASSAAEERRELLLLLAPTMNFLR